MENGLCIGSKKSSPKYLATNRNCNSKTPTFVFKKQLKWKPRLLKSKDNERKYSETHARGTHLEET